MANLVKPFQTLELQKQMLIARLSLLTEAQLYFKPKPAEWSALEVLDHLIKVEKSILIAMRRQLLKPQPISLRDRLAARFVINLMKTPVRVKVPPAATSRVSPSAPTSFHQQAEHWQAARQDLSSFLDSLRPDQFNQGLFHHPVGGWMNISSALAFISAHLRHHEYQIQRLKLHL